MRADYISGVYIFLIADIPKTKTPTYSADEKTCLALKEFISEWAEECQTCISCA